MQRAFLIRCDDLLVGSVARHQLEGPNEGEEFFFASIFFCRIRFHHVKFDLSAFVARSVRIVKNAEYLTRVRIDTSIAGHIRAAANAACPQGLSLALFGSYIRHGRFQLAEGLLHLCTGRVHRFCVCVKYSSMDR